MTKTTLIDIAKEFENEKMPTTLTEAIDRFRRIMDRYMEVKKAEEATSEGDETNE